jgi:hypothetical protein
MGKRNNDSKTRKLKVKKESLRQLEQLTDDDLKKVPGGMRTGCCHAPSLNGSGC